MNFVNRFRKFLNRVSPTKKIGNPNSTVTSRRYFLTHLPSVLGTAAAAALREINNEEKEENQLSENLIPEEKSAAITAERYQRPTISR